MIGTLPEDHKSSWVQHVPTLVHAYNCTRSNATGYSPYYLLYGRAPLLPIDIGFGVKIPELADSISENYIKKLKNRIEWAYRKAAEVSQKEKQRAKLHFDKKVKCSKLHEGDIVMVRKLGFQGKHKIADRWENTLYKVVSQREDNLPVYKIQNISSGQQKILHRNMLYPVQCNLDSEDTTPGVATLDHVNKGPVTRSHAKLLMKVNLVMNEHFSIQSDYVPTVIPRWLDMCWECWLEFKTLIIRRY